MLLNLFPWLTGAQSQIIQTFLDLPGAKLIPVPGEPPAVFVPGARKDRVLLVAHTDTVWDDAPIHPGLSQGVIFSRHWGVGIGADDRAGCAAVYAMRDMGHSLLLVPGEEKGCVGSGFIANNIDLGPHQFLVQFDRRGGDDLVYYDLDHPEFEKYVARNMPGYSSNLGSFSDISVLAPAMGRAGVNISIGFRNEHTNRETLNVREWHRTVRLAKRWLSRRCSRARYLETDWGWGPHLGFCPGDYYPDLPDSPDDLSEFDSYDQYIEAKLRKEQDALWQDYVSEPGEEEPGWWFEEEAARW